MAAIYLQPWLTSVPASGGPLLDERAFWQEADAVGYVDLSSARRVRLPNPKPSTATNSLRLPEGMLDELKVRANQRDVPSQSLLKMFLAERMAAERERKRRVSGRLTKRRG